MQTQRRVGYRTIDLPEAQTAVPDLDIVASNLGVGDRVNNVCFLAKPWEADVKTLQGQEWSRTHLQNAQAPTGHQEIDLCV